jgi:hypothetical protein
MQIFHEANKMASRFEDLDELTLRCRDEKVRSYIQESVASYRAGAYRACIVTTWIAVCFDIIEKIRELALAGDKEAEHQVSEMDKIRRDSDLTRALKFERELLTLARDKFELISQIEMTDLERLQVDRNRCAHPSLTVDDHAYAPSAELARLHLHSAITHLLQHPPVQGKFAIDRILGQIDSVYFPSTSGKAKVVLASGPLRRPRESLVRNLLKVLLKTILTAGVDYRRRERIFAATQAIQELHPDFSRRTFNDSLSSLFGAVGDSDLQLEIDYLEKVIDSWQYLDASVRERLNIYVRDLPGDDVETLAFLLNYQPLRLAAKTRVGKITVDELERSVFFGLPKDLADCIIERYLGSVSFDRANVWAKHIIFYAGDLTDLHVRRILTEAAANDQITGSFQLESLVHKLRDEKKIADAEFEDLLSSGGLGKHLLL